MRPTALLAGLAAFGVPALAFRRRDDEFKGNGKPYEDPADKGGRMLTVSSGSGGVHRGRVCCRTLRTNAYSWQGAKSAPGQVLESENEFLRAQPADRCDM